MQLKSRTKVTVQYRPYRWIHLPYWWLITTLPLKCAAHHLTVGMARHHWELELPQDFAPLPPWHWHPFGQSRSVTSSTYSAMHCYTALSALYCTVSSTLWLFTSMIHDLHIDLQNTWEWLLDRSNFKAFKSLKHAPMVSQKPSNARTGEFRAHAGCVEAWIC